MYTAGIRWLCPTGGDGHRTGPRRVPTDLIIGAPDLGAMVFQLARRCDRFADLRRRAASWHADRAASLLLARVDRVAARGARCAPMGAAQPGGRADAAADPVGACDQR